MNYKELVEKLEIIGLGLKALETHPEGETQEETSARFDRFHLACAYFPAHGDAYHEREEVLDTLLDCIKETTKEDDEIDEDALGESIQEYADSATPIYYHDLAKWFAENWSAVDEYCEEMGADILTGKDGGIMRAIGASYCYTYGNETRALLSAVLKDTDA